MTYSMPQSTNKPLPARSRARKASANTTGKPIRNGTTGRPKSAMPAGGHDEEADADIKNLGQIFRREDLALRGRRGMAADFGAERAGKRAGAERGELAGFGLDRLAVGAGERFLQVGAERGDILLPLGVGVRDDGVERGIPARRRGRDLRVGGPAEARNRIAQVRGLEGEQRENDGDHGKAENGRDPIFRTPGARVWISRPFAMRSACQPLRA